MNSPTATITAHIARSRELDKNVTQGPWYTISPLHQVVGEPKTYSVAGPPSDYMYIQYEPDAAFIASSRTLLPQYVEALTVAVAALNIAQQADTSQDCSKGNENVVWQAMDALSKIAAILSPP